MNFFLAQQVPTTFLPLWGQIILLVIAAVALFFQWRNSLAIKEHNLVKERCERLGEENTKLTKEVTDLKVRTNIEPLTVAFNAWQIEARNNFIGAMTRLEEIRVENHSVLTAIVNTLKEMQGREK